MLMLTKTALKPYSSFKIGDTAKYSKRITGDDIRLFGKVSGDLNPIHFDDDFAKSTIFHGKIAHGVLTTGIISAMLTRLAGPGTILLSIDFRFTQPVRANDIITAIGEITNKRDDKRFITVKARCVNQNGVVVLDGKAMIMTQK